MFLLFFFLSTPNRVTVQCVEQLVRAFSGTRGAESWCILSQHLLRALRGNASYLDHNCKCQRKFGYRQTCLSKMPACTHINRRCCHEVILRYVHKCMTCLCVCSEENRSVFLMWDCTILSTFVNYSNWVMVWPLAKRAEGRGGARCWWSRPLHTDNIPQT